MLTPMITYLYNVCWNYYLFFQLISIIDYY